MRINAKKIWIAAAGLAVVGGIFIAVGFMAGAKSNIELFHRFGVNIGNKLNSVMDYSVMEEFHSMDININAGNIKIVEGKEFAVKYALYSEDVECYIKNDTLYITEKLEDGIKLFGFNFDLKNAEVIVYIPKDMKETLNSLDLVTNMGEIETDYINANTINAESDMGDVELQGNFSGKVNGKSNMGEVKIEGEFADTVTAYSDMGDVEVVGYLACDVNAETSMGSAEVVTYLNASCYDLDVDTDLGDDSIEKNGGEIIKDANFKIEVYSNMGDAKVICQDK